LRDLALLSALAGLPNPALVCGIWHYFLLSRDLALLSALAGLSNPALVCRIVGQLPGNPARAILRSALSAHAGFGNPARAILRSALSALAGFGITFCSRRIAKSGAGLRNCRQVAGQSR
jgi:hypothetical protein